MGKYDGIDVMEVTLIENNRIIENKKGGLNFFIRLIVAALLVFVAFAGQIFKTDFFKKVSDAVTSAVNYNIEYIGGEKEGGDGVVVAYIEELLSSSDEA